jgi:large subunit ribosomal protein L15
MQFHNLKRNKANRKAKQVGRGGTRGKTSGKGTKGQNARSGRKKRPEMRDIIKRMPKLRGRGKNSLKTRKEKATPINLSRVKEFFKGNEEITAKTLLEKGIIKLRNGKVPKIKVLNG